MQEPSESIQVISNGQCHLSDKRCPGRQAAASLAFLATPVDTLPYRSGSSQGLAEG